MRPSAVRRRRTAPGNGTRPSARESRRSSPRIRGDSVAEQVRRLAPSRSRLWCVSPLVASVRPEAVTGDGDPDCHGLAGPGPEHLVRYRHLPLLTSLDGVDVTTLAASPRTGTTRGSTRGNAPRIVGGSTSGDGRRPTTPRSRVTVPRSVRAAQSYAKSRRNAIGADRWVPVGSGYGRAMVSTRPTSPPASVDARWSSSPRTPAGRCRAPQVRTAPGRGGGEPRLSGPTPLHRIHTHDSAEF